MSFGERNADRLPCGVPEARISGRRPANFDRGRTICMSSRTARNPISSRQDFRGPRVEQVQDCVHTDRSVENQNSAIRFRRMSGLSSSHSHTTKTSYPATRRDTIFLWSRSEFRRSFSRQNALFRRGTRPPRTVFVMMPEAAVGRTLPSAGPCWRHPEFPEDSSHCADTVRRSTRASCRPHLRPWSALAALVS